MMKEAYKILIGNILLIHPFAHQYKAMMKEVFCTIQKRNISSFSFGWLLYVSCDPISRFCKIGTLLSAQKYNLLNKGNRAITEKSLYFGKMLRNEIGK